MYTMYTIFRVVGSLKPFLKQGIKYGHKRVLDLYILNYFKLLRVLHIEDIKKLKFSKTNYRFQLLELRLFFNTFTK